MADDMPKDLFAAATAVRQRAYVPYSGFHVGAALRVDGTVVAGANVENASYGLSCCAERSAMFAAVAQGLREVQEVVVVAKGVDGRPISPCGACRQVLAEFAAPDTAVWLADPSGGAVRTTIGELLPGAFQKSDMGQ